MISTTAMRLATKGPSLQVLRRAFTQQTVYVLANHAQPIFLRFSDSPRYHSTVSVDTNLGVPVKEFAKVERTASVDKGLNVPVMEVGKVERTLKALDMALVRQIKAELMEVDANSDGRQVHI